MCSRCRSPISPQVGARVMSLTSPEKKMSKSDKDPNGCVYMLEKPEDILRKFKKAVDATPRPASAMTRPTSPACPT